mmetsp:Transcript_32697/g.28959  ORF Transcript_32697/g.28959 Transcript_32697/m.28959 type:complete len:364 (+) Transcript_32697:239-1330(+)
MIEEKLQEIMLVKDNEDLKRAKEKDLIKITELMTLANEFNKGYNPRNVKVVDSRPQEGKKESLALEKNQKNKKSSKQTYVSKYKQSVKVCKNKQSGKIKTIFLPHEDVNRLRGQIERLRKFKDDQKFLYTECLNAYEKDKDIKKEEMNLRKNDFENKNIQLKSILTSRNDKKDEICSDYFAERHRVKENVFPAVIALSERLKTTKEILDQKYEDELRKDEEIKYKIQTLHKNAEDYTNKFRNEVKKKEHKVTILKDQYMHLQKVYVENLKSLELELESYFFKENSIEDRRQKESATFKEDVSILKARVIDYENYIKRVKTLAEKKKAEELKEELDKSQEKKAEIIMVRREIKQMLLLMKSKAV